MGFNIQTDRDFSKQSNDCFPSLHWLFMLPFNLKFKKNLWVIYLSELVDIKRMQVFWWFGHGTKGSPCGAHKLGWKTKDLTKLLEAWRTMNGLFIIQCIRGKVLLRFCVHGSWASVKRAKPHQYLQFRSTICIKLWWSKHMLHGQHVFWLNA